MTLRKFAFLAAALALSAPALASDHVQPAVQPGGDIPKSFQGAVPPIPKGGDIPRRFTPPRAGFQYERRGQKREPPERHGIPSSRPSAYSRRVCK